MTDITLYIKQWITHFILTEWQKLSQLSFTTEVITSLFNAATERPSPPDQSLSCWTEWKGHKEGKSTFYSKWMANLTSVSCGQRLPTNEILESRHSSLVYAFQCCDKCTSVRPTAVAEATDDGQWHTHCHPPFPQNNFIDSRKYFPSLSKNVRGKKWFCHNLYWNEW